MGTPCNNNSRFAGELSSEKSLLHQSALWNVCKKIVKLVPKISFGVSLLWLVAGIVLSYVPAYESYTYENGTIIVHSWQNWFAHTTDLLLFLVPCGVVVVTVLCIFSRIKWKEKIAINLIISWLVGFACLFMIVFADAAAVGAVRREDFGPECYAFTDGQHTIVIKETSFLFSGAGTIYQIKGDNTAVVIGTFGTDDGLRNRGVYQIIWSEDGAEITYLFDHNVTRTETVSFEP